MEESRGPEIDGQVEDWGYRFIGLFENLIPRTVSCLKPKLKPHRLHPNQTRKKKVAFVKPTKKQPQQNVDHVTGDKIPRSFVFSRLKLPGSLKQLQADLRKMMLPYTALNLKEKKRNNLKDFLNVAGPMGVTHFLMLSKTGSSPYLRVARTPQGPTLTFKIQEYSLAVDIANSQLRPRVPKDLFKNPPLIVLSGFGTGEQHLKLTTIMFQNIFPAIDINTPVGVSRRIRKFVQNHQVPDLRTLQDVSDFVTKAGYGSESEGDDEAATVSLTTDFGRVNKACTKSAVKLQEIGPRMTLQLIKIEEGLCSGTVIFSEYENSDGKKDEGNEEVDDDDDDDSEGDAEGNEED
ncbi:Anticodon-binding [Cynara cardunculus var. scolymus]|uniref:Anticodon-binding n=1 Tax=Cynara cardunculus var. scolymus TaxID=59895 RepID=A0A103XYG7_CYNCS|nr:Anticodon-binding [Cynara cardunculus var. scolymus]